MNQHKVVPIENEARLAHRDAVVRRHERVEAVHDSLHVIDFVVDEHRARMVRVAVSLVAQPRLIRAVAGHTEIQHLRADSDPFQSGDPAFVLRDAVTLRERTADRCQSRQAGPRLGRVLSVDPQTRAVRSEMHLSGLEAQVRRKDPIKIPIKVQPSLDGAALGDLAIARLEGK